MKQHSLLGSILGMALLVLILILASCRQQAVDLRPTQPSSVSVDSAPVERLQVARSLAALGSLEARERVVVSPEIHGKIESIHFEEGAVIGPGDPPVLFRLDADIFEIQVEAAEAQLATMEANLAQRRASFQRQEMMYKERATTEAAYTDTRLGLQQAEATKAQAEANLKLARHRLGQATIRAPLSGLLGERFVSPGDFVREGQRLVEIVDVDPIEVSFSVPERHRGELKTGSSVRVETEAYPGRRFEGSVFFVAPDVDPDTRTVRLKAHIPNPDLSLQPGLFARVELVLGESQDSLVVPEEAIVPRGKSLYLYVKEDGVARRREITLGQRLPGKVVVLKGLDGSETVIVGGLQRVSDGFPVEEHSRPQSANGG